MRAAPAGQGIAAIQLEQLQGEFNLRTAQRDKGRQGMQRAAEKLRALPGPDNWSQSLFRLEAMARTARDVGDWQMAGLLAQIGNAINSDSLHTIGRVASWTLPFEGLYAAGLHGLISGTSGLTGVVLRLGPFGGSEAASPELIAWAFLYMLGVLALAAFAFSRRDL